MFIMLTEGFPLPFYYFKIFILYAYGGGGAQTTAHVWRSEVSIVEVIRFIPFLSHFIYFVGK